MARKRKKAAEATTIPDKTFPFEKLPPELRNMVYEYYLVVPRHVLITRRRQRQNDTAGAKRPFELYSLAVADGTVLRRATAKNKSLLGFTGSSLLRVNKTIHKEAESMLYGANRFLFTRNVTAMQFLQELGPRVSLLRHISLELYTLSSVDRIKPLLENLRSFNDKLETLEIVIRPSLQYGYRDVILFRQLIQCYIGEGSLAEKLARFNAFRFVDRIHRHQHRLEDSPSGFKYEVLAETKTCVGEESFGNRVTV
ncbi:hypothetical protein KC340_g12706 [Hortaea werneckii]|nr:hypothetical protein KC342_g6379 [Hortaea werneckii]KAI7099089.1 hypothetical protein KC339_g8479 [Hortaea werneckii]KAI7244128.1 hypothetical protein KC365_g1681 [Hortaea werneckii]KAI7302523.1 hypothetical protein KC340_g12706 [Hortaea werneckii]KAI7384435.1 hypothetical protein KC328_g10801 [Hortaea werneckii]